MSYKEHVFRCDCHDYHFLALGWYTEDRPHPQAWMTGYLGIGGRFRDTWRDRIRGAWHVLRGRNADAVELVLDEGKAEGLRRAIELYLADARRDNGAGNP